MTPEQLPDFTQASDITMQTYSQIAASYAKRHQYKFLPPFWQEIQERFSALIHASPGWSADATLPILDAGCGPGRDALIFAQQGFHVQAIDLSEEMLAQARQRCTGQAGSERIRFAQMDMHQLALPTDSCSGVWVSASLLHIPKRENKAVLGELIRVLAPGGVLALLLKEADSDPDERYDPAPENNLPRFFARYRGSELWDLLEQVGLTVVSITADHRGLAPTEQKWLAALALKTEHTPGERAG